MPLLVAAPAARPSRDRPRYSTDWPAAAPHRPPASRTRRPAHGRPGTRRSARITGSSPGSSTQRLVEPQLAACSRERIGEPAGVEAHADGSGVSGLARHDRGTDPLEPAGGSCRDGRRSAPAAPDRRPDILSGTLPASGNARRRSSRGASTRRVATPSRRPPGEGRAPGPARPRRDPPCRRPR